MVKYMILSFEVGCAALLNFDVGITIVLMRDRGSLFTLTLYPPPPTHTDNQSFLTRNFNPMEEFEVATTRSKLMRFIQSCDISRWTKL